jgi:hypothetical protein
MLNKIARFVCVLAGLALLYFPATGQEKAEMRMVELPTLTQSIELRSSALADSAITYAATGEKVAKTIYTRDAQGRITLEERFNWENNRWVNAERETFLPMMPAATLKQIYMYGNLIVGKKQDEM